MAFIYYLILLIPLALTSCATIQPSATPAQNKNISVENRVSTLSSIQNWNLSGLIAIRQQNNSGSASIQWAQFGNRYQIHVFGPLGVNSFELKGQPGYAELAMGNGKRLTASSPEEILKHETGWALPVSNMYYWIRGLSAPGSTGEQAFDRYHHLIQLKQSGWTIQYLNYTSVKNIDVPSKIFLYYPQLNVKIVISQWQF